MAAEWTSKSLRAIVIAKGLATPEMAASFSEAELLEFLFLPGFSTAKAVTDISGRGVGLDAVQEMAKSVGGVASITSRPGQGLTIQLELPLTLSVLRTFVAEIGGEPFAFPLTRIASVVKVNRTDLSTLEGQQYFSLDGERVGVVSALEVLDMPGKPELGRTDFGGPARRSRHPVWVGGGPVRRRIRNGGAAARCQARKSPLDQRGRTDGRRLARSHRRRRRFDAIGGDASAWRTPARARAQRSDAGELASESWWWTIPSRCAKCSGRSCRIAGTSSRWPSTEWTAGMPFAPASYDLTITDVDMPRMTGIELVSKIKADPKLHALPVIIVSYKDREEDRMRGLDAGADRYLTKSSFHDETLLAAVAELIGLPE